MIMHNARRLGIVVLVALFAFGPLLQQVAQPSAMAVPAAVHATEAVSYDPAQSGQQPGPGPIGEPAILWGVSSERVTDPTPAVDRGMLFLNNGNDNAIHGYDAITGEEIWSHTTGRSYSAPIAAEGQVFVPSVNGLWSFDARTGFVRWVMVGPSTGMFGLDPIPLVVSDGVIYLASSLEWFAADILTGEVIWRIPSPTGAATSALQAPLDAMNRAGFALGDGKLFAGMTDELIVMDATTGEVITRLETEGSSYLPAVGANALSVATDAGVTAYDLDTFETIWQTDLPEPVSAVAIGEDAVIVGRGRWTARSST